MMLSLHPRISPSGSPGAKILQFLSQSSKKRRMLLTPLQELRWALRTEL